MFNGVQSHLGAQSTCIQQPKNIGIWTSEPSSKLTTSLNQAQHNSERRIGLHKLSEFVCSPLACYAKYPTNETVGVQSVQ